MSGFLYCVCTDVVLEILANEFNDAVVGYEDDICLGIDDNIDPEKVIERVSELFAYIGLEVNRDKCHCTKFEDVKFMGITYHKDKSIPIALAPELLGEAK